MAEAGKQRQHGALRGLAFVAAALVSACSTVVPHGPTGPVQRPPAERPGPTQAPPRVEQGIPHDVERNRIALLVPLSGPNAGPGNSLAHATQMAQLDSGSDRIRITTYDTATGAAAAASRALADGAQLIVGPLLAEDTRAVAPIARAAHVPVISFSNDVSVAGNGVYTLGYNPAQAIERVVDYAHGQGVTSFGALVPNSLYGQRSSTTVLRAVESSGGQVNSLQTYDRSLASINGAVARLAKNAPYQAVLIADSGATAAAIVPVMKKGGISVPHVLGTELWNSESNVASRAALNGAWFASVSNDLYRQFAVKYRARFGVAPYRLASMGYDAVLLIVRITRDWPAGTPFPEDRLHDSGGFAGLDGAFRFGRDDVAERALEVQEIRDGTTATVSPAPSSFGR
jgi:branched-chain amino acid transport system substrate-binding protein